MTRLLALLLLFAPALAQEPPPQRVVVTLTATVIPESRHVACIEAEPGDWHVVGDLRRELDGTYTLTLETQ